MELMARGSLDNILDNSITAVTNTNGYDYLLNACNSYYHYYPYPYSYSYPVYQESKFDKAFKIIQKLMDKDIVKCDKVKDFIKLVGEISELL